MSSIAYRSFASQMFPAKNITFYTTNMAWAVLTGVSQSANAFVLYVCSSVYRARMRKTLAQVFFTFLHRQQQQGPSQIRVAK
jgi:hypothetical protein